MIAAKLSGGLGNQMFQYAAARRLAEKHNTTIALELSWFGEAMKKAPSLRPYALDVYQLMDGVKVVNQLPGHSPLLQLAKKASAKLKLDLTFGEMPVMKEKTFAFNPEIMDAPDNVVLDGYWQSELYFADIADIIRHDFTVKTPLEGESIEVAAQIQSTNAVSLHVRRGDYVNDAAAAKMHGMESPLVYYDKAIAAIAKKVKTPHFYVFSDDPKWCKDNLKTKYQTTYVDHNPESKGYDDMRLMSLCQHHIIANSSFSWWGAWLNPSKDKLVYTPKTWFNDPSVDTKDIRPASWIQL